MDRRILRSWLIGLPLLLIVAGGAVWTLTARERPPGDPSDDEQVALGQVLYSRECARCHAEDLSGELGWVKKNVDLPAAEIERVTRSLDDVAPAHDASGDTWRRSDDVLFKIVKDGPARALGKGQSRMPAFKKRLLDEEIWAVIAFMKSHWPDERTARR